MSSDESPGPSGGPLTQPSGGPLWRTLGARASAFDEALADRLGLNATDLRCLELVMLEPDVTPGRLAEATGLTSGAVTGVLDRLEKAGYVRREADPGDRRRIVVRLLAGRGRDVAAQLEPLDRQTDELLARYEPRQRVAIEAFVADSAELLARETARLRVASRGGFDGDTYSAPLGEVTRGRLVFQSGAPRISLNVAPLGPSASARIIMETSASRLAFAGAAPPAELIHASFDGPLPDVRLVGGAVSVRYRRSRFASRLARIALNGEIPWTIEIAGGLTDLTGSLEGVSLIGLGLQGGVNHVTLELPAPSGTSSIRLEGVASSVSFRRPSGVPVSLRVRGGISHLRLDERRVASVKGDRAFTSGAFATSPDRYEIEVLGGASDVRVGGVG
jgi:DNA-binding MarR family transcriptional regulator